MKKEKARHDKPKFKLELIQPFSTFKDGEPQPIPFIVDGLLTCGGLSAFGSKPKQGKSSFSRYEAVQIAKGARLLGRATQQGEVIMVSLEDPLNHIDSCFRALGYDPKKDALIQTVQKVPPKIEEICGVLSDLLSHRKDVRFVTVDTLAKILGVSDLNDYMETMKAAQHLHNLAREFTQLHIQVIAHNKKAETTDPFDAILGSTALRGEPDTNIVISNENGHRIIQTETRIGRNIPASVLKADLVESAGADVVENFWLDGTLKELKAQSQAKKEVMKAQTYEQDIIEFLRTRDTHSASRQQILANVVGSDQTILSVLQSLAVSGTIERTGAGMKTDPYIYTLTEAKTATSEFLSNFGRVGRTQ